MFDSKAAVSSLMRDVKPSGIRKYFGIAETMPNAVSLGVGEPDFITPRHIMQAGIDSLLAGKTQYTANSGIADLRLAISEYLGRRFNVSYRPEDEVAVTVGGSEAIDLCLRVFLEPGDEVLIPEPCFVCYDALSSVTGAKPVAVRTTKEHDFKLMPEDLRAAITPKTKMLILSYPSNPTGAVMTRDELMAVADVIRDTNILVISDEIYAELTYGFSHTAFSSLPGMWERTILVSGFSKAFAMTGWRLGYCCGPKELMEYVVRLHQYALMCASTPAQYAGLEAMRAGEADAAAMRDEYDGRRKYLHKRFLELGFDCFEPKGAFYIFPDVTRYARDGEDFVETLLKEQQVAVVPGVAFGDSGKNHVRISYAYSMEKLKTAMDRIELFVQSRK
jgi:aminotransferase